MVVKFKEDLLMFETNLLEMLEKQGAAFDAQQKKSPYLFGGKLSDQDVCDFVRDLMEKTITGFCAHPYAQKAEELLLQACCFYLVKTCYQKDRSLLGLAKMLRCGLKEDETGAEGKTSTLDFMFDFRIPGQHPCAVAKQCYAAFNSVVSNELCRMVPRTLIVADCLFRVYAFSRAVDEDGL